MLLGSAVLTMALMGRQAVGKDIVDTAVEAGSFKTLAAALQADINPNCSPICRPEQANAYSAGTSAAFRRTTRAPGG
jgi:hypothetical protein